MDKIIKDVDKKNGHERPDDDSYGPKTPENNTNTHDIARADTLNRLVILLYESGHVAAADTTAAFDNDIVSDRATHDT